MIRPSRSASMLVSSGAAETRQVSPPGAIVSPDAGSLSGTPAGGSGSGSTGSLTARSTASTRNILRQPTSARVIFSTASAEVRSGITRNPA